MTDGPLPDAFCKRPEVLDRLKKRYAAPGRYYHDWSHIEQLIRQFSGVETEITNADCVLYSIYYHDAVYDPLSSSNEEDSAALFAQEIGGIESTDTVSTVSEFIIATKTHQLPAIDDAALLRDCRYFLDLDMSILGAGEEEYKSYAHHVRLEYKAFEDAVYNFGRIRVLEGFLESERIFLTDYFFQKYEESARHNIKNEIFALKRV